MVVFIVVVLVVAVFVALVLLAFCSLSLLLLLLWCTSSCLRWNNILTNRILCPLFAYPILHLSWHSHILSSYHPISLNPLSPFYAFYFPLQSFSFSAVHLSEALFLLAHYICLRQIWRLAATFWCCCVCVIHSRVKPPPPPPASQISMGGFLTRG